jgi:outer membrane biosynthesis protein TonB
LYDGKKPITLEEKMEKKIGHVTHFFGGPSAAVLRLSSELKVGDNVHIVGATTDFKEKVTSMQIDHADVERAGPGDDVAILVKDRVREGDEVFLVEEGAMMVSPPALPMASRPSPTASIPMSAPAKPKAKPKAKAKVKKSKTKAKPRAKPKAKARPKAKAKKSKAKAKAKVKPKAKSKAKAKAKKSKSKSTKRSKRR